MVRWRVLLMAGVGTTAHFCVPPPQISMQDNKWSEITENECWSCRL
jgi:hypothetical protein